MEAAKDDAARVRLMLIEYATELANETPVLCRFTDCIPPPDGLGGYEERARDRAYRAEIAHPTNNESVAACIDCLTALKDTQTSFDTLRGQLRLKGLSSIAEELSERRNRRATDIDRMIDGARAILIKAGLCDYRKWEAAAQMFNDGIAADVSYIQAAAKAAVDRTSEHNGALFAPVNERLDRIETKLDGNTAIVKNLAEELTAWREWVQNLATKKNGNTSAPKLCATIQKKIVELWQTFTTKPADCEDSTERDGWRKHKRTYAECLTVLGNDDVWHGQKLKELIPDARSFERVIHNAKEKKRQKRAKPTAASTPQARRNK